MTTWNRAIAALIVFLWAGVAPCWGRPAHKKAFADYFGTFLNAKLNDCRTCHLPPAAGESDNPLASDKPHNPFGARLKKVKSELSKAGKKTDIPSRLEAILNEDSDGDGVSNLLELLTGHNPGDPQDKPSDAELRAAETIRVVFLESLKTTYRWTPFETVQRPALPKVKNASWIRNPIDAFIAAEQNKHGLKPRPEASKTTLLRRVYLDLIGLPPTRAELHAFLTDNSSDAYEKVVDRLLASPRYGERWGRHWMDVWRYSDWAGYGAEPRDSQPHIWHWRDWIIESLNQDKGYDRMIQEMLAADELAPENSDALRATGFLSRNWYRFNRNVWLDRTIEHTSKAFLGVTLNRARCHDHFFDPIAQQEYYQFRAIFEPHEIAVERIPGQPDPKKDALPRVFDASSSTPTYLMIRGDEANPDKSKVMTPAVPVALGGRPLQLEPVRRTPLAMHLGRREAFVREEIAASAQAIVTARAALDAAKSAEAQALPSLTAAFESDRKAVAKLSALRWQLDEKVSADAEKQAIQEAVKTAAAYTKARENVLGAPEQRRLAENDLALAEARRTALLVTLDVEKLEGGKQQQTEPWKQAALNANTAQRRVALFEAKRNLLAARFAEIKAGANADHATAAKAKLAEAEKQMKLTQQESEKPAVASYSQRKGKYASITAPVNGNSPYTLLNLDSYPETSTGRRLALARWISDKQNPLTARVAMNQIWLRHFGKALVPSVFDFGKNGQPPSHPALLDWLAAEFMNPSSSPLGERAGSGTARPLGERVG